MILIDAYFFQGHAKGNRTALLVRSVLQSFLKRLGRFTQRHCGKVILFGFLFLIVSAIGLIKAKLETNAENLWIEGVCFLNNSFDFRLCFQQSVLLFIVFALC